MSTDFKVIRQMLLDYQANPVPLTPLGYYYLDMMIQYHRNYNEWYNNLGSNHEQEQNQGPTTTPAVAAPSLPSTPISRNLAVEEPTATQETVAEGEQPQMPSRRISRVNRLTARPRRLFQEELALSPSHTSPSGGSAASADQPVGASGLPDPASRLNCAGVSEDEKYITQEYQPSGLREEGLTFSSPPSSSPRGTTPSFEQLIGAPVRPAPTSRINLSEASKEEQKITKSQEATVTQEEQVQRSVRRLSRVNRLTARPRRLFQEEIALCSPPSSPARGTSVEQLIRAPVRSAPFSRLNKSKASEEEKERQSVETPKRPNRGIKRRNEQMEEPTPKRLRIAEDR